MALLMFGHLPGAVWWSLLVIFAIGVLVIWISHSFIKKNLWQEIFRDIGIAFLVSAVVSGIYEFNTRSVEEHETVLTSINRAMSAFIPDSVWNEIKEQVLRRNAIRHNVRIELKLRRSAELPDGRLVPMPAGRALLWVSYSYELQGLNTSDTILPIQHELTTS